MPEHPTAREDRTALRELRPLDPPMVPFALGGMALWLVAGLILLAFRHTLSAHGHTDWLWICVAGFFLGFPGWAVVGIHDRHRRERRARAARPEEGGTGDA
jgi:hypothetical protein